MSIRPTKMEEHHCACDVVCCGDGGVCGVPSSTEQSLNRQACVTLGVDFIRGMYFDRFI